VLKRAPAHVDAVTRGRLGPPLNARACGVEAEWVRGRKFASGRAHNNCSATNDRVTLPAEIWDTEGGGQAREYGSAASRGTRVT